MNKQSKSDPPLRSGRSKGLIFFFVVTYGITLCTWGVMAIFRLHGASTAQGAPPPSAGIMILFLLGGFSPSLAGLLSAGLFGGAKGLREVGKKLLRFRIGWKWYAVIIVIPLATAVLRLLLHFARGETFTESPLIAHPAGLIGFTIQIFFFGPISEEMGWRGFALERLTGRNGKTMGSLILGSLWALWHLPLFFIPGTAQQRYGAPIPEFLVFAAGVIGLTFIFTWIYTRSGGSLWAAVLFHAVYNFVLSFLATLMDGGLPDRILGSAVYILIGAALAAGWNRKKESRKNR